MHLPRQSYLTKAGTRTVMRSSRITAHLRDPLVDEAARMAVALDVVGGAITNAHAGANFTDVLNVSMNESL